MACRTIVALLALGGWSAPTRARAQTPTSVTVAVDATAAGTPLERVWPFHGYDEINYTTLPEGTALLETLAAAHSAPVHIRNHFLLNTGDGTPSMKWGSTNVYTEDAAGNPIYSWALTDGIMDAITGAGAFPFVEIGFMPEALSTHPTPYQNSSVTMLDGGCFYPPTDYTKWADLISAWAMHANGRYPQVGARWLWELWNEPDFSYWNGTVADYAKLYDYTEAALHAAIPDAALGGPAVAGAGGSFLTQFLKHCATGTNAVTGAVGTRLDLITFHAKGGAAIVNGHVEMDLGNQLRLHRAGFNAVAAIPQFKQTPIYVTEADPDGCAACSVSSNPADAYRTSPAYGAYEMAMMKHSLELESEVGVNLGGLLTWAFTFPGTPYFAGYRVLATNGIHMPVLGAFELLGRLDGTRLPLASSGARPLDDILAGGVRADADVDGLATLNGAAVQVLLWNYHDDLVTVGATPVHLAVTVPASFSPRVRLSHLRVDESHGDAYTVWVAQGTPASPSASQLAALQQAMDPAPLAADRAIAVAAGGSVGVDFDLPRFAVSLVTITPAEAGDGGIDAGDTDGSPDAGHQDGAIGTPGPPGGGCGCQASGPGGDATALLAIGALVAIRRGRKRRCRGSAPAFLTTLSTSGQMILSPGRHAALQRQSVFRTRTR